MRRAPHQIAVSSRKLDELMRDVDVFWHYQMKQYGCALAQRSERFDFTTTLCESPTAFMVRIQEDA